MQFKLAAWASCLAVGASSGLIINSSLVHAKHQDDATPKPLDKVPTRQHNIAKLKQFSRDAPMDMLVIGGGATGAGCTLDAATRGLKVALVERSDFASGTSSQSTKLVHGGVRYLEKAVMNFDIAQLKLVWEALHERKVLLDNASHLCSVLPIVTPCYKWWEVPYYWLGLKAYDAVAGRQALLWSKYLTPSDTLNRYQTLSPSKDCGLNLKGSILYYDGQFNDSKLNVTLACTAAVNGAVTLNYMEFQQLIKNEDGKVIGAKCRDRLTSEQHDVYAKVVVNAGGPYVDSIRRMSDPSAPDIITPSAGTHITLPSYVAPGSTGMIVPKSKDGRVVFLLPWLDHVIAGTTDVPSVVTFKPKPTEQEIAFIIEAINDYLTVRVRRSDVLSAWTGIRPLAADPQASSTSSIVRDHLILQHPDGMITVTGGKWTTYRKMAEEAVDAAIAAGRLPLSGPCTTASLKLIGSAHYTPAMYAEVARAFNSSLARAQPAETGGKAPASSGYVPRMEGRTAAHLVHTYGDKALEVLRLAAERRLQRPLVAGHPMLEAEVVYAAGCEYCETVEDFIARRSRLAYLDVAAARQAVPRVAELLAQELGWSSTRRKAEVHNAYTFLNSFDSA